MTGRDWARGICRRYRLRAESLACTPPLETFRRARVHQQRCLVLISRHDSHVANSICSIGTRGRRGKFSTRFAMRVVHAIGLEDDIDDDGGGRAYAPFTRVLHISSISVSPLRRPRLHCTNIDYSLFSIHFRCNNWSRFRFFFPLPMFPSTRSTEHCLNAPVGPPTYCSFSEVTFLSCLYIAIKSK